MSNMVLCLGPSGAGKTLLLKRLQEGANKTDVVPTIPTVGTNLTTVNLGRRRLGSVVIRELGGAMAPIWSQYFSDASAVIYVLDSADACHISASTILLLDVLSDPHLLHCPFLIVFNKCDAPSILRSIEQLKQLMQLSNIQKHATQKTTVVHASARNREGLQEIKDWLLNH